MLVRPGADILDTVGGIDEVRRELAGTGTPINAAEHFCGGRHVGGPIRMRVRQAGV